MQRLKALLADADSNRGPWRYMLGTIPEHYKRITVDQAKADRLARLGAGELMAAYGMRTYYTQAMIAGAMLSGDYDTIAAVTPSQYGKSILLGYTAPLLAYNGQRLSVAGATGPVTDIIMGYARQAVGQADPEIKGALIGEDRKKIDKLDASLSKTRLGFATGGYVEAITLGDTFGDIGRNKAVGRGTAYIVDEAANVSDQALSEIGRRELSSTDGRKQLLVMISNPHKPGAFYDALTDDHPDKRTLIVWMDALTAVQEGRWTVDNVLSSEFAKHEDTRTRYWMCELPGSGSGMFPAPVVDDAPRKGLHVLGIDAAYKGKDNIELCDLVMDGGRLHVAEVATISKADWIDGVTGPEIVRDIARVYSTIGAAMACVDVGYGVWLVEGLAEAGCNVRGINFGGGASKERAKARHYAATNAANMRAEMHLDLQALMEEGRITFSPSAAEGIKDALPFVTSERKASGKVQIRPKIEIKNAIGHSPDKLDAVLLAVHAAVMLTAEEY